MIFIAIPLLTLAQEPDSASALFGMREAERNFARESVTTGRKNAFVNNLAERSVIFTDRWITSGRQYWKDLKPGPLVLKWEPEYMDIALSQDFGVSTGPWEAQEYRPNTLPLATGYFLSVWQKDDKGTWKVILDAGSTTPPVNGAPHSFRYYPLADRPATEHKTGMAVTAASELKKLESELLIKWKNNPSPDTYMTFLDPQVRMQTNGHLPTTNKDSVSTWISSAGKSVAWSTSGSGASDSGDLGFTYGYFENSGDNNKIIGHYVRIWKRHPDNKWLITIEMRSFE